MPKYKLADYRYGREEMLALYIKDNKVGHLSSTVVGFTAGWPMTACTLKAPLLFILGPGGHAG